MERGRAGLKYIFSTEFATLDELLAIFGQVTGRHPPRWRLPAPLVQGVAEAASLVTQRLAPGFEQRLTPGAVRLLRMGRRADWRSRDELGYQPTSIASAVREAYDDFVRRGVARPAGRCLGKADGGNDPEPDTQRPDQVLPAASARRRAADHRPRAQARRDPIGLLQRGRQRFGDVWSFPLLGSTVTVFAGPAASKAVYQAPDDVLSPREAYRFMVPIFGKGVAYDVSPELMGEQLGWVYPALREERHAELRPGHGRGGRGSSSPLGRQQATSTCSRDERDDGLHRRPLPDRHRVSPSPLELGVRPALSPARRRDQPGRVLLRPTCRCRLAPAGPGPSAGWSS